MTGEGDVMIFCVLDITCSPLPPLVPTHSEYSDIRHDGRVSITALTYPVIPTELRTLVTLTALETEYNNTRLPTNYMANLTYSCGTARRFLLPTGDHEVSQTMSCQWDKSWTPTPSLDPCDWVACLKPPTPPLSTHLRVSDWFGDPIAFGEQVRFVCERGYFFEADPGQLDVRFTCQDGAAAGFEQKRGFFDVPEVEADWPRCLLGCEDNN